MCRGDRQGTSKVSARITVASEVTTCIHVWIGLPFQNLIVRPICSLEKIHIDLEGSFDPLDG